MGVWVVTDWRRDNLKDISLGLLGEARRAAEAPGESLSALVLGLKPDQELDRLFSHGADQVVLIELPDGPVLDPAGLAQTMAGLMADSPPRLILFPASPWANELAGRLAAIRRAGLVTNAARLEADQGRLIAVRNIWGDRVETRLRLGPDLALISLKPKELQAPEPDPTRRGQIVRRQVSPAAADLRVLDYRPGDPRNLDLREAELIVAGGKGVGGAEGFARLQRLADLLGAGLGGSREAVDRGWLDHSGQIGQTGKTVTPRCLIALGISGAIQFLKGMDEAQFVVAVNIDPKAPIFNAADLKIAADLEQVVPALIDRLEEQASPEAGDGEP